MTMTSKQRTAFELAPPQGSILPIWHRGGAPNYQLKPIISRHVQDPLKAWQRERGDSGIATGQLHLDILETPDRPTLPGKSSSSYYVPTTATGLIADRLVAEQPLQTTPALQTQSLLKKSPVLLEHQASAPVSVTVFYCRAGTFDEKVVTKLANCLKDIALGHADFSVCSIVKPLDQLQTSAVRPCSMVLLVGSSTEQPCQWKQIHRHVRQKERETVDHISDKLQIRHLRQRR